VTELFDSLRTGFDYIVVDTPPMLSEHVLSAMDVSSHLVLLTTPEVPALKNLRVTLDMLDLLMYPDNVRSVVLNRSDSKVGLKLEDVERVVRAPIAAHVPSSGAVPASINKGKPIALDNPGHPVSKAITRFVEERLMEQPVAEPVKGRWRRGSKGRQNP
jgi:MinD-like ATPase involved in chromosome partitioning or flagellar assembly